MSTLRLDYDRRSYKNSLCTARECAAAAVVNMHVEGETQWSGNAACADHIETVTQQMVDSGRIAPVPDNWNTFA